MNPSNNTSDASFARLQQRDRGPAAELLGHRLVALDRAGGRVEVEFQAREHLFNPMGVMQGGLTMAMLEQALTDAAVGLSEGTAAASIDPAQTVILLEVHCNFLTAVGPGLVCCHGTLVRQGRSTAFVEAKLFNATGELSATASAVATLETPEGVQL